MNLDWVDVPGGVLTRGTPAEEIDDLSRLHDLPRSFFAKEAPRAEVVVASFRMTRTPVTLGQWTAFCAASGEPAPDGPPEFPVEDTTWEQAVAFCRWASDVLSADVRLPSETQWERAARGDDAREYPWGDTYEPRRANLAELAVGHALPVGSLPSGASPFGLLDMAGNVDEWTSTVYAPYPGAPSDVPPVESHAHDVHITRGGGYIHHRDLARCARRHGIYDRRGRAGIRLVVA